MKGLIILFAVMGLVLVGCSQDAVNSYGKKVIQQNSKFIAIRGMVIP